MERIRNKFVSKMGAKKYYQKLPCEDLSSELKVEATPENEKENRSATQPQSNSSLEIIPPPRTKILSLLQRKTGREDKKVKYTQLKSSSKQNQTDPEEIYSNSFTDEKLNSMSD